MFRHASRIVSIFCYSPMFKLLRVIQKLLTALCLLVGGLVVATGVYGYYYRDQIIQKFLTEANQQLSHPIHAESVQLTALKSFPSVTLMLHEVVVEDGTPSATDLLTARRVDCTFNVLQLLRGQYVLDQLSITHGQLCLGSKGSVYPAAWQPETLLRPMRQSALTVRLQKVVLKDMALVYNGPQERYVVQAVQMQASWRGLPWHPEVELRGQGIVQSIHRQGLAWDPHLTMSLRAGLRYETKSKTWRLHAAQLQHGEASLTAAGSWSATAAAPVALTLQGKNISPQLLWSYLSQHYQQKLASYDLQGAWAGTINVHSQQGQPVVLEGSFALQEGALATRQFKQAVALQRLAGSLCVPDVRYLQTASLRIDELKGTLAGSALAGSLVLHNFHDPHLQCTVRATADLATLAPLFTTPTITEASGQLIGEGQLQANLQQLLRGDFLPEEVLLAGALQAQAVQWKDAKSQLHCQEVTGQLVLRNNTLILKDCAGRLGPGHFVLNGTVDHCLPYLWGRPAQPSVKAKLYADHLDLDVLLPHKTTASSQVVVPLPFIPCETLTLDCDIEKLTFRNFQGRHLKGQVKCKEQTWTAEKLQLGLTGGKVLLHGTLDTSQTPLRLQAQGQFKGVQIGPLFAALDNFHQNFLVDRHLRGELLADFALEVQADRPWRLRWETLQADINARLKNGALIGFEPMQQLTPYVAEETLADLRFSELKNHIHIQDQTIHLPPMEVHSNVTRIQLSGTHTFDGKIAYDLVVPFTNFRKRKQLQASEGISADALAGINLFLKLQGHVNDYTITYDTQALRRSLQEKWQAQGKALQEILQGKYQHKKQLKELSPNEYFEFDEEPQ